MYHHEKVKLEKQIKLLKAQLQTLKEIDKNERSFSWAMTIIRNE